MKNLVILLVVFTTTFISCKEGIKSSSSSKLDTKFEQISEDFLSGYLAWRPELSVALGFHEFDGKVSNFCKESLQKEHERLIKYDQMLNGLDISALSPGIYFDLRILQCAIKNEIFNFEEMESYTKNPMTYAGALNVSIYVKRNFAPLEDRLRSIIAFEKEAPIIFATAKSNLVDSLAKPYVETAIQIAKGSSEFLKNDLKIALRDVKNDSLMAVFEAVNNKAISELNAFTEYLEKEKLPKAHNNYALGREKYRKMLLYGEDITLSPEKILEVGFSELEREKESFNAAAKIVNPNKKPVEVYKDLQKEHTTSDSLITNVKKNVEAIRQFLIDKKIVTIPSEVKVLVEETPQYARSIGMAWMDPVGPFENKATESFYYITPINPIWTEKQKEDWLSMFDYYSTDIMTIHEVYPGHYTQCIHLNASSSTKIEKTFYNYGFDEGWAHYTEKMMIDEGYGNTGDLIKAAKYRLAQSGGALRRLCRLCVSIKTHCQVMSVEDATRFFMDNWYQGEEPSREEAIRGTFDPSYLYYSLGKLQILKLRDDYQKQEGKDFSLQKFHDLLLDNGMPPIQILREKLLKDKNIWTEIL